MIRIGKVTEEIRNIKSIQVFLAAFEARNVTRAAQEMNISQSSVSYHIKKLEDDLTVTLFRRTASGLEPTEEGAQLAKHVERGLRMIRAGLERIANRPDSVRVALLPMFASRWFSPRLGSLLESNPNLQLSIQNHSNTYAKLANPERFADLGIQWGRGNWGNFHVTRLWPEKLVVVCSPGYLQEHPIRKPADIAGCTLLHVDDTRMWDEWLTNNGLALSSSQSQMMLEDRHFQLSSTINGLGVSLFTSWLVQAELRSGALVNPFGKPFETSFAYHVIVPRDAEPSRSVTAFFDWIREVSREGPRSGTG